MRYILPALFLTFACPAYAETISAEIGRTGLAATEARLGALLTPTDEERFALGGVEFLRAIEGTFQDRWTAGMTDRTGMLPLLRLPLEDNPNPAPFDPKMIVNVFAHAADKLAKAQTALTAIPESSDFGLEIALDDIWFDVNSDGARSKGEGIADILGPEVLGGMDESGTAPQPLPTVRFDVADAAWLAAYSDMLGGICAAVRAYDPTEPITRVMTARAKMETFGRVEADPFFGGNSNPDVFDMIAMILATLNQTPDKALMAEGQTHFLNMVAENRQFWTRVAAEKDNVHEWLPNDNQQSALGIDVPPGTGAAWMVMLSDFEAVMKGEKLIPYWRIDGPAGINVAKMFTDPRPIDVAGWIQGWDALPYLEKGPLVSNESTDAFDALTSGRAMLFALYLN
ncbi:MAG: hypothetical protein ABIV25_04525 [Paracoccaceae bacterium]